MSWDEEHLKYRDQVAAQYAKMYNQDSKKIGPRGSFNNLRGIRQEYRENFDKYHSEVKKRLKEVTYIIKNHLPEHVQKLDQVYRGALIGENRVPPSRDEILNDLNELESVKQDLKYLLEGMERFSEISLHDMELSRLIGHIKNSGFPGELKFKKAIRPSDKKDWLEAEYEAHSEEYKTDDEWAIATTKKFKDTFNTPIGSPESIKRHGIYKGLN